MRTTLTLLALSAACVAAAQVPAPGTVWSINASYDLKSKSTYSTVMTNLITLTDDAGNVVHKKALGLDWTGSFDAFAGTKWNDINSSIGGFGVHAHGRYNKQFGILLGADVPILNRNPVGLCITAGGEVHF